MQLTLVLGAIPIGLWLGLVWLRVPAAALFLSVYVGHLLSSELSDEAFNFLTKHLNALDFSYVQAGMLVLPVLLTVVVLRSKTPKSRVIIEAIPNLFAAVTLMLFLNEHLNLADGLDASQQQLLNAYKSFVVSIGAVLSLISAWMMLSLKHVTKKH